MSRMCWTVLWLACLASGRGSRTSASLLSSVSDAVRVGATIASRILYAKRPDLLPPPLQKLRERMKGVEEGAMSSGRGKNEAMALLLRQLGVNSTRVREIAFEGLVSVAHLMHEVLVPGETSKRNNKTSRDSSLLRFVVHQPQVSSLLSIMLNPHLVEEVLEESRRKLRNFAGEQVECILSLMCKAKPFVGGMQRSLRFFMRREGVALRGSASRRQDERAAAWETGALEDRMYYFLPGLKEVVEHGDRCDETFPLCVY